MSRYILIRRLRGPVILLLIGGLALLHQMGVIGHFWHLFWPLLLILVGLMLLAERFAMSTEDGTLPYPGDPYAGAPNAGPPYQGQPYQGPPYPGQPYQAPPYAGTPYQGVPYPAPGPIVTPAPQSTSIVPAHSSDFDKDPDGGQS